MAQSHETVPFFPVTSPQWDPTATLDFRANQDGGFYCSGVKINSNTPCGWKISGEIAEAIRNQLGHMSGLLPHDTIQFLDDLAQVALCEHHKTQRSVKVNRWKLVIEAIPSTQSTPVIPELLGSSPSQQTLTTPHSTLLRSSYLHVPHSTASSDVCSRKSEGSISSIHLGYDSLWKKINNLHNSLDRQKSRIDELELACEKLEKGVAGRKNVGKLWARLKASFKSILRKDA
jgi:hypothetical protein